MNSHNSALNVPILLNSQSTNLNPPHRFEQLTLKANTLREELHTEVEKMLNDIIKFKIHIQKSLGDYESFVAQELENEGLGLSGDVVDDGDLALGGGGAGAGSGRVADGLEDGDGDGGRIEVHGKAEVY